MLIELWGISISVFTCCITIPINPITALLTPKSTDPALDYFNKRKVNLKRQTLNITCLSLESGRNLAGVLAPKQDDAWKLNYIVEP